MSRNLSFLVLTIIVSVGSIGGLRAGEPHLLRLDGPVIFDVAHAKTLENLPIRDGTQFGCFRCNDRDPAYAQHIKYWIEPVQFPGGTAASMLAVYYNVSKAESFCGLWIKVGGADWRRYREGEIVLRLRRFEPLNKVAVFDRSQERVPDTHCTDNFKVELKTGHKDSEGRCRQFAVREYVRFWHENDQKRRGYFDVRIPLRDFGLDQYLGNVALLALTFENRPIAESMRRGNIGIQRVVLTSQVGEDINNPPFARFTATPGGRDDSVGPVEAPLPVAPASREPRPLNGPVVIRFDRPLDQLEVPKRQFGIFRDEEPRHVQYIEESWATVDLPHKAKTTGFLRLRYEVPRRWNGWWLKLMNADWSPYRILVLRLRPGENCTPVFKLELKTKEGGVPHPVYVRLTEEHDKRVKQVGYADVCIPLSEFGIADLSRVAEFVIVFVSDEIPRRYAKGELLVESIRLGRDDAEFAPGPAPSLLDDLGRLGFEWFRDNRHPQTGMVLDRAPNWRDRGQRSRMSSIASTGYHLSLLPEWVRLGWLTREAAETQALQALDFASETLPHHQGLFYHFVDWETGQRWKQSEISTLDSAIFFNGCMVVAEAFGGRVAERANSLLDRADWTAFLVKHPRSGKSLLSLGWSPEKGLLGPADVRSSEMAMPLFLAVGSRTHPIDAECWYNTTVSYGKLGGHKILNRTHPLFTHFIGVSGWHDLRAQTDRDGVDLYANARLAALANREFCNRLGNQLSTYRHDSGGWWAISAGDSPDGYLAAAPVFGGPDGTVWPLAALATVPWIPQEIQDDLARWRSSPSWRAACGDYGLSPFNLDRRWVGNDLIGIDVGSFCLSLANHRNGTAWRLWMRHPVARTALDRLAFKKTTSKPLSNPLPYPFTVSE